MDKQKQVRRVLTFTSSMCCVCAILGWLGLTRLLQMDKVSAIYLAAGITLYLQVSVSIGFTQNIRQTLTGQSAPESLIGTKEFSQKTNKRLTYVAGGILLLLLLSWLLLPSSLGNKAFLAIVIGIAVLRLLSRPVLQLYDLRKYSSPKDAPGMISPWDFLVKFLPIWGISLLCTIAALAGLYAATLLDSLAYLAVGLVIATILLYWELQAAKRFVAGFASPST